MRVLTSRRSHGHSGHQMTITLLVEHPANVKSCEIHSWGKDSIHKMWALDDVYGIEV